MKAYIVYQGCGWVGDWHAMLVREDGQVIADHICSSSAYMPGDLWTHRKERQSEHPGLDVNLEPMFWEQFKEAHPDVFALAFTERKKGSGE